jgi:hypothetical protein
MFYDSNKECSIMAYDNKTITNKRTIKVNVKRHRCQGSY